MYPGKHWRFESSPSLCFDGSLSQLKLISGVRISGRVGLPESTPQKEEVAKNWSGRAFRVLSIRASGP